MERICITGSSGFLGSVIMNSLKNQSIHVETIGRSFHCNIYCNLSQDVPLIINDFDAFIHVAGKAHSLPKNTEDEDEFFRVNFIGTKNLIKGIELSGFLPRSFVFISTVAVYGLDKGEMLSENTPRLAKSAYGLSKILAEDFLIDWGQKNNIKITIIRLPLIIGLNPPGNLGFMINGIKKGLYFNIGGGLAKKSMVLASDIAKFVLMASEVGGIYNLTDGYHPTFFELSNNLSSQLGKNRPKNLPFWFAKLIALGGDLFGKHAPLNTEKLNKIMSTLTFDDSKARIAFGWNSTPVLEGFRISDLKKT